MENQRKPQESPPANACAAPSVSRSTRRRTRPGTIIGREPARAGAAYATYVGSWRKRFRITKGEEPDHAVRGQGDENRAQLLRALRHADDLPTRGSPHMVNIPRALFAGPYRRQPLYHVAIEELQEWAYTGEPLVPLKGFPGVVWQRSKRKRRRAATIRLTRRAEP